MPLEMDPTAAVTILAMFVVFVMWLKIVFLSEEIEDLQFEVKSLEGEKSTLVETNEKLRGDLFDRNAQIGRLREDLEDAPYENGVASCCRAGECEKDEDIDDLRDEFEEALDEKDQEIRDLEAKLAAAADCCVDGVCQKAQELDELKSKMAAAGTCKAGLRCRRAKTNINKSGEPLSPAPIQDTGVESHWNGDDLFVSSEDNDRGGWTVYSVRRQFPQGT